MSAVGTLAVTIAAAVGTVALYRYVDRRTKPLRDAFSEIKNAAKGNAQGTVLDYEQDPESGVFKPKKSRRN